MNETLDKQIVDARLACKKANENLERLMAKKNEFPHMVSMARTLIRVGHGDAYVQSRLYASRTANISIDDIVEIIADVKKELEVKDN
jgi:hypothetical protein